MFFKLYNLITHNLFFKNIFSQSEFETYYNHSKNELLNLYNSNSSTALTYTILQYIIIPFLLLIIITFVVLLILNRYNFQKKNSIKRRN